MRVACVCVCVTFTLSLYRQPIAQVPQSTISHVPRRPWRRHLLRLSWGRENLAAAPWECCWNLGLQAFLSLPWRCHIIMLITISPTNKLIKLNIRFTKLPLRRSPRSKMTWEKTEIDILFPSYEKPCECLWAKKPWTWFDYFCKSAASIVINDSLIIFNKHRIWSQVPGALFPYLQFRKHWRTLFRIFPPLPNTLRPKVWPSFGLGTPNPTQEADKESTVHGCICNNVIKLHNSVYLIRWKGGSVMCSSKYFVLD